VIVLAERSHLNGAHFRRAIHLFSNGEPRKSETASLQRKQSLHEIGFVAQKNRRAREGPPVPELTKHAFPPVFAGTPGHWGPYPPGKAWVRFQSWPPLLPAFTPSAFTFRAFTVSALLVATFTTTPAGNGHRGIDRVSRELIEDTLFHILFSILFILLGAAGIVKGRVRVRTS
jgi:hypothetical protein